MKTMYLMKGMALMAIALVAVSCNKNDFDQNAYQQAKEREAKEKFISNVMGGQQIDPNQNWRTTETGKVTVNSDFSGTLRIFTANPHGTKAAALYTQDIQAGSYSFTVSKPQDAGQLYAKLTLPDGTIRVSEFTKNAVSFVNTPVNAAMFRAAKRASQKGVTFPDAPESYPTTYPDGTSEYTGEYKWISTSGSMYMDETVDNKRVELQGAGINLYVVKNGDGNITPNYWYLQANTGVTKVFICPGVVLDISQNRNIQSNIEIYVGPGATLKCNEELVLNTTAKLYVANGGILDVPSIDINAINWGSDCSLFYNQGTTTIPGRLYVENGQATIVNEGTLNVANLGLQGSGKLWNKEGATMNVANADKTAGTTIVNSINAVWINDGVYNTVDYDYTAGSVNVWNRCKLTVDNLMRINFGMSDGAAFKMDGGSSVVVKDLRLEAHSRVIMAGNSIIKVTHEATMYNTCLTFEDEGIIGPSEGDLYAVLQAPVIKIGNENETNARYVCYNGNVYVATDSHFAQKNEETNESLYRILGNAKLVDGQTAAPYTIPANGNCSDGYNGGGGGGGDETPMYYYYAFEDLGTIGDFDFNDVVLRVSAPVNKVSEVTLMAAGGTLPVKVLYGDITLTEEVHATFDVDVSTMVNTGRERKAFMSLGTVTIADDADMADLPFAIVVTDRETGTSMKVSASVENVGEAPLMIVVNGYPEGDDASKWFWPLERINITTAYPEFGAWGANASTNQDWYLNYTNNVWKY